jgi:hypothetical protein
MEPEGSLPHSQVLATCPYPEPARSSVHLRGTRLCFVKKPGFYGEELSAYRPTPKV